MGNDALNRTKIISDIKNNFLVEASAGSGKTSSLVSRLVSMVENGIPLEKIVTITFTKKAANEFYDRFYKMLLKRSKGEKINNSPLPDPTKEQQDLDKEALKNIDLCFMGTIDSFCYSILKEHPFEANLPSNINLVEDVEAFVPIYKQCFNIIKNGDDENLKDKVYFFERTFSKDDRWSLISHFVEEREYEVDYKSNDEILKEEKKFASEFKVLQDFLVALNNACIEKEKVSSGYAIIKYLEQNIEQISSIEEDDYRSIKKLLKELKKDKDDLSRALVFKKDKFDYNRFDKEYQKYFIEDEKKVYISETISYVFQQLDYLIFIKTISFLNQIKHYVADELKKSGLLSFNDVMIYLNNILRDKSKWEKIKDNVKSKHAYYLIDEFQDTSPTQMELFLRLTSETYFENIEDSKPTPGSLFLVGDPKQSIYRFRGADFLSYSNIKKIFKNKHIGEVLTLDRNFRSNHSMHEYFNLMFHKSKEILSENEPYQTSCPEIPLIDDEDKESVLNGPYTYNVEAKEDAKYVANFINNLINTKEYQPKDFMIICKSKTHLYEYKKELEQFNIPTFIEGKILFDSYFIRNIIGLFKYIVNGGLDSILEFVSFGTLEGSVNTIDIDEIHDEFKEIIDWSTIPSIENYKNPGDYLEALINCDFIKNNCGDEDLPNLIYLVTVLKEKVSNLEVCSYKEALEFLESCLGENGIERVPSLKTKETSVKIANLHKVKGLEARVVILASPNGRASKEKDANFSFDHVAKKEIIYSIPSKLGFGNVIKNPREDGELEKKFLEAEENRLLYVAATRAREVLLISNNTYSNWKALTYEGIRELDEEYFELHEPKPIAISYKEIPSIYNDYPLKPTFSHILPSKEKTPSKLALFDDEELYSIRESNSNNKKNATLIGSMVHRLMEEIVKCKSKKLDELVCETIASEFNGEEYIDTLRDVRKKIYDGGFDQKDVTPSFDNDIYKVVQDYECYTEVPFSYMEGSDLIYGVIDLILIKGDKAVIIDYKTDQNIKMSDHSKQLEAYEEVLRREIKDIKEIEKFIYSIPIK